MGRKRIGLTRATTKLFKVGTGQPFCLEDLDLFDNLIVEPQELPSPFMPRLDGRPQRLLQKFFDPFEDGMVGPSAESRPFFIAESRA